jgi:hypothetical protein
MSQNKMNIGNTYQIRIKEALDHSAADRFDDISFFPQGNGETLLVGQFADQSALRGLLDQLWNFNFTILSVNQNENENHEDVDT